MMTDFSRSKKMKAEYATKVSTFDELVYKLGLSAEVEDYYWYHTIDLGGGLVTPGCYDFRNLIDRFGFPEDMTGLAVLDIGPATGFFAFEFERRGAAVTVVELPSIEQWDMLHRDKDSVLQEMRKYHNASSNDELTLKHLHGPFAFCHRMLKSKVKRCFSTVYNLSPEILGADGFDMVFCGDVLPHLMSPIEALDSVAKVCKGTLYFTGTLVNFSLPLPVVFYRESIRDNRSWWKLSTRFIRSVLRDIGFEQTEIIAYHTISMAPSFRRFRRPVMRAWRGDERMC
ncbi:MAG: methyltransferase domain-containing protein [Deltaproteobacteria bacterium]|nr:methyltransferase domain-containing protein [Deltaproteobacteria bacterium]